MNERTLKKKESKPQLQVPSRLLPPADVDTPPKTHFRSPSGLSHAGSIREENTPGREADGPPRQPKEAGKLAAMVKPASGRRPGSILYSKRCSSEEKGRLVPKETGALNSRRRPESKKDSTAAPKTNVACNKNLKNYIFQGLEFPRNSTKAQGSFNDSGAGVPTAEPRRRGHSKNLSLMNIAFPPHALNLPEPPQQRNRDGPSALAGFGFLKKKRHPRLELNFFPETPQNLGLFANRSGKPFIFDCKDSLNKAQFLRLLFREKPRLSGISDLASERRPAQGGLSSPKAHQPLKHLSDTKKQADYFLNLPKNLTSEASKKVSRRAKSMFDQAGSAKKTDNLKSLQEIDQEKLAAAMSPKKSHPHHPKGHSGTHQVILNQYLRKKGASATKKRPSSPPPHPHPEEIPEKKAPVEAGPLRTPRNPNHGKLPGEREGRVGPEALSARLPFLKLDSEKITLKLRQMTKKVAAEFETVDIKDFRARLAGFQKTRGVVPPTSPEFYESIKMVGEGSFGKVFLAVQRSTNRLVALKRLEKATFKNEATRKKIMTELEIQKALFGHCNIVKLLEVFETEDFAYFVMEYAANGDLRRWLEKRKRFSEDEARYAFFQIASGVRYIHSHGFIHRDIKLDNVLIDEHMHYKICDFGVGRPIDPNELVLEQCGTPAYLAPEIIREHGYRGFSADVWSLGVLLYFMLVGQMPFRAPTIDRLNEVVLQGKYQYPEDVEISEEGRQLISRMLCLDPAIRAPMEEVLSHPWVNSINLDRATVVDIKGFEEKKRAAKNAPVFTVNEQVVASLAGLGFDPAIVRNDLVRNEMNYATASYFTLEKDYA